MITLFPQPSPEVINFAGVLADIYPALNATSQLDAVYWNDAELYQWCDEATQRLARQSGVFVTRDTSITVTMGNGTYNLPANQISTIQADLAGVVLRPRTVQELEAADASWPSTQGYPSSFVQNTQGVNSITTYPAPGVADNGKTLGLVMHQAPPTIGAGNTTLLAPTCLREYFTFYSIGEARAKESKGAMPEVAQWMRGLTSMFEGVIEQMWGESLA